MRILVVSEVFYPENFIINDLVLEWKTRGHDVEVLTSYPSYPVSYVFDGYENRGYKVENWDGVKIHRFPFVEGYRDSFGKKILNYIKFVTEGRKVGKRLGGDFDLVFVSQTGPLTVALPALMMRRKFDIPVAIWTLDIWPDAVFSYGIPNNFMSRWALDMLIKYVYRRCDKIFVSSRRFAETINRYVDSEIVYTPNWLKRVDNVKSNLRLDREKFNFTFTGNISRYQNLVNTVKGFIRADLKDCVLNIVGDGSYMDEVKSVAKNAKWNNVVFCGRFPYNEMHDILCQSDVLVLPLMADEGIMTTEPFKIQSYLDAGKPIYGILGGSGRDIIEENKLGLCANPMDIDDIASGFEAMITFAKDNSESVEIASKNLMNTRFNKDEIIGEFERGLKSIIGNKS